MACALPPLVLTWDKDRRAYYIAELLGVAIWIALMAGLDGWLLKRGRKRASRALTRGALAFGVLQGILSLVSASLLMYLYLPFIVSLKAGPAFFPTRSRFAMTLVFTIDCGMSALIVVLLFAAMFFVLGRRPSIDSSVQHGGT